MIRVQINLLFTPYHVLEEDGVKIGFIGLSEATRYESIMLIKILYLRVINILI